MEMLTSSSIGSSLGILSDSCDRKICRMHSYCLTGAKGGTRCAEVQLLLTAESGRPEEKCGKRKLGVCCGCLIFVQEAVRKFGCKVKQSL